MLRLDLISIFPEQLSLLTDYGISKRAIDRGLVEIRGWNPRDYTEDRHRVVDDRPFGGQAGMVMMYRPLRAAIQAARDQNRHAKVIYLSPQGSRLDQAKLRRSAQSAGFILLAGRYGGVDQRLLDTEVDEEWSIGDYVLSGGELAALVVCDALIRLLPGALGNAGSLVDDSFFDGLLGCPQYTRPRQVNRLKVPRILLSGDHAAIGQWQLKQALGRTWLRRPDLLAQLRLDKTQQLLLREFQAEYEADDLGGENG